ncbi:putative SOS response-associated peptidase YedK [Brevibacillus aydinogluensis]|jgi:putative SOS response-associated peptidase YedK|uniref:SOS response-associated peptidase n=1 Tax=Brevibacillus aydinogluensis TaxID=927786 RepID=UPI00289353E8|nr:SOS response-associated peptidase [Brevibacillus aydinogluensis]MDT3417110.1 putative SOS response-associated peptidase YedK [Brevibacillus aydinogluensis]
MCGRFTLVSDPISLQYRFTLSSIPFDLQPRYNIAPSQNIYAIISLDDGNRRIGELRWGLIPSWAKDERIGHKMINARAETLTEKPAFRNLINRKRCIIPADGFFEWKQTPRGKQPMRILLKSGELFAFAALYDTWINRAGQKVHTCTIITTQPNELVRDIHDRMPVILQNQAAESIWLDRKVQDTEILQSLLTPYPADQMTAYPVSPVVGNPKIDEPVCIEPF